jgi:hypothetical protein
MTNWTVRISRNISEKLTMRRTLETKLYLNFHNNHGQRNFVDYHLRQINWEKTFLNRKFASIFNTPYIHIYLLYDWIIKLNGTENSDPPFLYLRNFQSVAKVPLNWLFLGLLERRLECDYCRFSLQRERYGFCISSLLRRAN